MESSRFRRGSARPRARPARADLTRAVFRLGRGGSMPAASRVEQRLKRRSARIGGIGLGYVGLPLAVEFAKAGVRVTGVEINEKRGGERNRGRSYIHDGPTREGREL